MLSGPLMKSGRVVLSTHGHLTRFVTFILSSMKYYKLTSIEDLLEALIS